MTIQPLLWILAWFLAARLTRFITADKLTKPWRTRWRTYWERRAPVYLTASQNLVPEADQRELVRLPPARMHHEDGPYTKRQRTRYYRMAQWYMVYRWFLGCPWCVGWWIFAAVTVLLWGILGWPYYVLGGPWWFTLPAVAAAGNWLYAIIAGWLDDGDDDHE